MAGMKRSRKQDSLNIDHLVEAFLDNCEIQGLGHDSLHGHRYALQLFFRIYEGDNLNSIAGLRKALGNLLRGKQDAYYNKLLNAVRKFFDYCLAEGIMRSNPAMQFRYRRPTVRVIDHSEETILELLTVMDKDSFAGFRDYVFAILILDTGIRPSEALQLRTDDIDFAQRHVRVRREYAKTRMERYLPVSVQVLEELRKLIAVRPEVWKASAPVLCTCDGHKMPSRGMQSRFRDYSKIIRSNITPYHLRHVFGLWYIRNGGDAFALQSIMGHTTMEMTRIYVNLGKEDIKKNHEKASPFANLNSSKRLLKLQCNIKETD